MVASEGAAIFVLERLDRALGRGARVLAVVAGGGSAGDAHHVAAPHPDGRGAASAMRRALADAGAAPDEVDALVAHATATLQGDMAEARALRAVFGPAPALAVTAPKSALGHGLGAAGAFGVMVAALALHHRVLPATRGLDPDHVDPDCVLDHVMGVAPGRRPAVGAGQRLRVRRPERGPPAAGGPGDGRDGEPGCGWS